MRLTQDRIAKVMRLTLIGGGSALLGYAIAPHDAGIADTSLLSLYIPLFLMMVGAGLVVLAIKNLID
jgi:hypothetical protein